MLGGGDFYYLGQILMKVSCLHIDVDRYIQHSFATYYEAVGECFHRSTVKEPPTLNGGNQTSSPAEAQATF